MRFLLNDKHLQNTPNAVDQVQGIFESRLIITYLSCVDDRLGAYRANGHPGKNNRRNALCVDVLLV